MPLLLAKSPISMHSNSTITKGVVSFKICLIRIKTLLQKQISLNRETLRNFFITESFPQVVKICLGVYSCSLKMF